MSKPDGHYCFNEVSNVLESHFLLEKEMCDYIEEHIEEFCSDILNTKLLSYKREYRLDNRKGMGSSRLDFLITNTSNENIIIECKKPKYVCENQMAIGQLLGYQELANLIELPIQRKVLVTSKIDVLTTNIIRNNNLGIELIGFDKTRCLILLGQNGH